MKQAFDIEALRAVVAGIDLGSFAHAAVQLGRSQSAVSMQLKKLEQQVGKPLFVRRGRGLVPTEAGEALAAYARRIIALNDEAAYALGARGASATLRLGLPQDFFDDVMPATLAAFVRDHPDVHVDVRAGLNHRLADEVRAGRLDGAIAFFPVGAVEEGERLFDLPMRWFAHESFAGPADGERLPLVLFNHPCLFRQAALQALDRSNIRWRAAVTTPSLPGIWGALRSHLGIAVRTEHGKPDDIICVGETLGLPELPPIDVRLLRPGKTSPAVDAFCDMLRKETIRHLTPNRAVAE